MGKGPNKNAYPRKEKFCEECVNAYQGAGKSIYCSVQCSHRNYYNKNMLDPEWRLAKLLSMAKNRAKEKKLDFDLTLEYLKGLWDGTDGKCQVSNIPFELRRPEFGKVHPYAPSIDRIEPSRGYTKGNVRIIVYQLNVALSEFGLEQFNNFVKLYMPYK